LITEVTLLDKLGELTRSRIANGEIIGFVEIAIGIDFWIAIKWIGIIGENRNLWTPKLFHLGLSPLFELSFIKSISKVKVVSLILIHKMKTIIASKPKEFTTILFKIIFLFLIFLSVSHTFLSIEFPF